MKFKIGLFLSIILVVFLSGCNLSMTNGGQPAGAYYTQAAQTIVAQLTYSVLETMIAEQTQIASGTATPNPANATATPIIIPTQVPPTDEPTDVPPTPRPPTATPYPVPCDALQFIDDVTIDDGATITANKNFTKTWRLKNVGTCSWNTDYDLVFVSGDRMDGLKSTSIDENVHPGETVDVSVSLTAPESKGDYTGYWMLRSDDGSLFGFGYPGYDKSFWVHILVKKAAPTFYNTPFNFADHFCSADWYNKDNSLPCPGSSSSEEGYAIFSDSLFIEKGGQENESAIWVHPEFAKGGKIVGAFTPVLVETGDHFKATIGCIKGATKCDVDFTLYAKESGGSLTTLGSWNEVYDHVVHKIDVDLAAYDGEKVVFYLSVNTNGNSFAGDDAFWLNPVIE